MNLDDIKIGDKFMVSRGYWHKYSEDYYEIVFCKEISPKQCVIGKAKYRKSDACPIGHRTLIQEFNQEEFDKGQNFLKCRKVENYDYRGLSDEKKIKIYEIINRKD